MAAVQYVRRHNRSQPAVHDFQLAPGEGLPPEVKQRLLEEAKIKFQAALNNNSSQLNQDLKISSEQINQLVNKLASEIVSGEMEHYRLELGRLHDQANSDMRGIRGEISKHETELKAKMELEIEAEKQRLVKQIDTKLADAVGSFLSETLQHNVDLGSQTAYLLAMLEEHKVEFIKEVGTNEAKPAG